MIPKIVYVVYFDISSYRLFFVIKNIIINTNAIMANHNITIIPKSIIIR